MSSMFRRLALATALSFSPMAMSPLLADVLVVRSSGPSAGNYPPGRRLADSTNLALLANDTLTILSRGGTRTFRGPGTVNVTGPIRVGPLASAISERTNRRSRIGAVRGQEGERGLWDVNVTQPGTYCVRAGSRPSLWRANAREAASLSVNAARVDWPAGRAFLRWPEGVAVVNGAQYDLSLSSGPAPATIRIVTIPSLPADPVDIGELLYRNGCQPQFEHLLASLPPA